MLVCQVSAILGLYLGFERYYVYKSTSIDMASVGRGISQFNSFTTGGHYVVTGHRGLKFVTAFEISAALVAAVMQAGGHVAVRT